MGQLGDMGPKGRAVQCDLAPMVANVRNVPPVMQRDNKVTVTSAKDKYGCQDLGWEAKNGGKCVSSNIEVG